MTDANATVSLTAGMSDLSDRDRGVGQHPRALSNWLTDRMRECGFRSMSELARAIDVRIHNIPFWLGGTFKPALSDARRLAAALDLALPSLLEFVWGMKYGTECPCGCGGYAVMPDRETARTYAVRRVCSIGGEVRVFRSIMDTRSHTKFCSTHRGTDRKGKRLVPRTTFTCVGFSDLDKKIHHAPACPLVRDFTAGQLARLQRQLARQPQRPWEPVFIDPETKTYRSANCGTGSMMHQRRVALIKSMMSTPDGSPASTLRIASEKRLEEIAAELGNTPYPKLRPRRKSRRPDHEARVGVPRTAEVRQAIRDGRIREYWRRGQASYVIPHCEWCGKLMIRKRSEPARFHRACKDESRKSPAGRAAVADHRPLPGAPPRGAGRPCTKDHLRDFTWAMQYYICGVPQQQLADQAGCSRSTVRGQIKHIVDSLPVADLIAKRQRRHIELLIESSD